MGLCESRISPLKEYSVISSVYRVIELIMRQRLSRSEKAEVLSVWTVSTPVQHSHWHPLTTRRSPPSPWRNALWGRREGERESECKVEEAENEGFWRFASFFSCFFYPKSISISISISIHASGGLTLYPTRLGILQCWQALFAFRALAWGSCFSILRNYIPRHVYAK